MVLAAAEPEPGETIESLLLRAEAQLNNLETRKQPGNSAKLQPEG
jgi:hypothetical protein